MNNVFLPGSTIGILGSGQLGRMLAMAARQMGYRVHVYSPEQDSPAGQIADKEYAAAYTDLPTLAQFAQGVDVITYEFENVPAETAHAAAAHAPLYPGPHVLHIAQNRLREKQFCRDHHLPVTPFAPITSFADVEAALPHIGLPAILKTTSSGYDGKGQILLRSLDDARAFVTSRQLPVTSDQSPVSSLSVSQSLSVSSPFILEAFIPFSQEISVVAARGRDGSFAHFGAIENEHAQHILDISIAPARIEPEIAVEAVALTKQLMEALDVVGVLCVEFFLTRGGQLLINEMAPRPHNSSHLTLDACVTSQFEQQLRAVCGLPLGDTTYHRPAAMANLLGDLWFPHRPNWSSALAIPGVKLHLYGKQDPRRGRKMGHITALAETGDAAAELVRQARERLRD
jgi:5-(carboxyamino)imidazole ribonucleotide synthase